MKNVENHTAALIDARNSLETIHKLTITMESEEALAIRKVVDEEIDKFTEKHGDVIRPAVGSPWFY